jgi:HEAT repeat protein
MKKRILFLFVASLLLTFTASAQDLEQRRKAQERMERGQKTSAAIEAIANMSPSLKALRGEVNQMIIEAAKTGDPALMPHLKALASDKVRRTRMGSGASQAHIALARLGDSDVLPEIFAELDSADITAQDTAIAKLAQIGNKEAFRKLYQLLDDNTIVMTT